VGDVSARVPYLAKLASKAAGSAPLLPGRPLFPGTAYPAGRLLAADDSADFPRGRAGSAGPAARVGGADAIATPARPDRSGLTAVMTGAVLASRAQQAVATAVPPTTSALAGPAAQPAEPRSAGLMPSASAGPPAGAARSGPPEDPAIVPSWGPALELPHPLELASVTGEASTRPAAAPDQRRASGPGPHPMTGGAGAGSDQGPAPAAAATDRVPPLPLPALAPRPDEATGPGPLGSRQQMPGGPEPARVSIGTIEVTVVPPAGPASHASESRPPAQTPRGRPRPPSLLATTAGAGRLRDGLRRWYGIAQG
jgi:hypothetical protein